MAGELRRLGRETLIYGVSTILGRFLNFLLLPFYTHFLAPGDFGVVTNLFAYIAFFNILYQFGMDQAYLRFATSLEIGDLEDNFSTAATSVLAVGLAISAVLVAFWSPLGRAAGLESYAPLVKISAAILAMDALATVPLAELRRAHRAWSFAIIKSINIGVNVFFNVWFLWHDGLGVRGVFYASALASASSLLLLVPVMVRLWRPRIHWALLPGLLAFALPYIPSGLASMAVQVIDRPILMKLTNDVTVGIYSANYRLGIFMMLVINMFDAAWRPFFLDHAKKPDAPKLFAHVTTIFLAGSGLIVLAVSLFIGEMVRIPVMGHPLIHPSYWSGLPIVPVVLLGYLFNGAYYNFMPQVYLPKRTDLLIWVTAIGAVINVGSIFALVPRVGGMMGAAWATLLAYLAMAIALHGFGRKLYPIPYEWGRLSGAAAVLAACWGGAVLAHQTLPSMTPAAWALLRLGAIGAYALFAWPMILRRP